MYKAKIETYYINYRTSNKEIYFIHTIKRCKFPHLTKDYKRLRIMLNQDIISGIGYCTEKYYNENKHEFIKTFI